MSKHHWQIIETFAVMAALIVATIVVLNLLYLYGPQSFVWYMLSIALWVAVCFTFLIWTSRRSRNTRKS